MKKTLSVILTLVLLLSSLTCFIVPAYAIDEEGGWLVKLSASHEEENERDPDNRETPPLPGYKYTDEGFTTISPDYKDFNPHFSIVSSDVYDLYDFSMTVKVDDYSIYADNWLSFTVWSECNGFAQGDTSGEYGYGWTSLVRDMDSDGTFDTFQEFDMSKNKFDNKGKFTHIGTVGNFMPQNDKNEESDVINNAVFTFAIKDGKMSINGVELSEASNDVIRRQFPNGLAYIGVTLHSADSRGKHKPQITILEVNGEKPTGTDSREPEDKQRYFGEMIPSDSVPANTPAIRFDTSFDQENTTAANDRMPSVGSCRVGYSPDNNNFAVYVDDGWAHYLTFNVKDEITYNANDFRMVAFLFKDLCTCSLNDGETACEFCSECENIGLRYCAGTTLEPDNISVTDMLPVPVNPVDGNGDYVNTNEHYLLAYAYIEDEENYIDRINAFRIDIRDHLNDDFNQYEIVWGGVFAKPEYVLQYVYDQGYDHSRLFDSFVEQGLIIEDEISCPPPVDPPEDTTSEPDTNTDGTATATEIVEDTFITNDTVVEDTSIDETALVDSNDKTERVTENPSDDGDGAYVIDLESLGCTSTLSMTTAVVLTSIVGLGVTLKKKKDE